MSRLEERLKKITFEELRFLEKTLDHDQASRVRKEMSRRVQIFRENPRFIKEQFKEIVVEHLDISKYLFDGISVEFIAQQNIYDISKSYHFVQVTVNEKSGQDIHPLEVNKIEVLCEILAGYWDLSKRNDVIVKINYDDEAKCIANKKADELRLESIERRGFVAGYLAGSLIIQNKD